MEKFKNLFVFIMVGVLVFILGLFALDNAFILLTAAAVFACIFLYKKKIPKFELCLFIVSLLIRVVVIFAMNTAPVSDFKYMLDAAIKFNNGTMNFNKDTYFTLWGYQTGFTLYEAFVLKIFKSPMVLKILNAVYSSVIVVLIYKFAKKITNEKIAKVSSFLYSILVLPLVLNTILTNQHLSTMLSYLGLYCIFKDKPKLKDFIIAGVLVSLGNVIRPEGIIVVFSMFMVMLLGLTKKNIRDSIIKYAAFAGVYLFVGFVLSQTLIITNINKSGLSNKDPLWKFVLGFNGETCGAYAESDTGLVNNKKEAKKVILERINSPLKVSHLVVCKTNNFWLQDGMSWDTGDRLIKVMGITVNFKDVEDIAMGFNTVQNIVCYILCLLGVLFNYKDKKHSMLMLMLIIVTFAVYTLIEIQPRYIYFIQVALFIYASYGIKTLIDYKKKLGG